MRQRWRATVVLSLLIGIAGAAAIGAADGARRTQTAFGRMRKATNAADVLLSVPRTGLTGYYDAVARLPEVETSGQAQGIGLATYRADGSIDPAGFPGAPLAAVDGRVGVTIEKLKLLSGRIFDPSQTFEAMGDHTTARRFHLKVGSLFRTWLLTDQSHQTLKGKPVTLKMVGFG